MEPVAVADPLEAHGAEAGRRYHLKEENCFHSAEEYRRKVCVCHVLRYTPFYSKIKEMLLAGAVGRVMNIPARKDVWFFHQAHSFVRGNWRDTGETSPMLLPKCCHDMDCGHIMEGTKIRRRHYLTNPQKNFTILTILRRYEVQKNEKNCFF